MPDFNIISCILNRMLCVLYFEANAFIWNVSMHEATDLIRDIDESVYYAQLEDLVIHFFCAETLLLCHPCLS